LGKNQAILCDNFLMGETAKFGGKNKAKGGEEIAARVLAKGEEIHSRPMPGYGAAGGFRFLRCSENKFVIDTADNLIVASVPGLKNIATVDYGTPEPGDAILVEDAAYCVKEKVKLLKTHKVSIGKERAWFKKRTEFGSGV
jgi:hypothetical protein